MKKLHFQRLGSCLQTLVRPFFYSKERKYESCTPLVIRPPEVRFEPNEPLSFSTDIWTLACTIWSIIAQRPLFEGFLATEDDMTCEHVDTLGVLPLEWWRRWEARRLKFTEDGKPMNRNPFRSWDDRFKDSVQQPGEIVAYRRLMQKRRKLFSTCCGRCFHSDQIIALPPSKFSNKNGW